MGNEIEDALNDDLMQAIKKEDGLLHAKIDYDEFYLDWGTADENADNRHYNCPECGDEITTNYREAEVFLLGE